MKEMDDLINPMALLKRLQKYVEENPEVMEGQIEGDLTLEYEDGTVETIHLEDDDG